MISALLITFREGLEAALIIGIVLAFLAKTGNRQWFKQVWWGTITAVLVSILVGAILFYSIGALEGRAEQIFEGSAMLLAAIILTWMIFWMRKQARSIKSQLHTEIQAAIGSGSSFGIIGLAFVAVVREGIETALFLFASTRTAESPILSASGGIIGLILALAIGYSLYKGSSRLNLRTFFNITGLLLILFAAGLFTHGIHELQEANIIPTVIEHIWDIGNILPEGSAFGNILTAIFGYNANPSLIEAITYFVYLIFTLIFFLIPTGIKAKASDISLPIK